MREMRSRAGLDLVELRITVVIVIVVALISIPSLLKLGGDAQRKRRGLDCLLALAAAVEKKDAAAACPVSGKPFAPGYVCPDPGRHLEPELKAWTTASGVFALEQALPPEPSAREIPGDGLTLVVESMGNPLQLKIVNGAWYRWLWAPLAGIYFLCMACWMGVESWDGGLRRARAMKIFQWILTAMLAAGAVAAVGYFHRTARIDVDGERNRIVRSVSALGIPCGTTVHEGVACVAALKGASTVDLVALKKAGNGYEAVVLFTVPEASLGVARLCQRRFLR